MHARHIASATWCLMHDAFDLEDLRLSGIAMRKCLGPNLLKRVNKCAGPTATGPEVFLEAINQVKSMAVNVVGAWCNQLGDLKLKNVPAENVSKLGETLIEKVDQIEASGSSPDDLMNLATEPFTTGSNTTFETFATNVCIQVVKRTCNQTVERMMDTMSVFHRSLVQANDCLPARAGKQDQDQVLSMLSTLNTRVENMQKNNSNSSGGGNSNINNGNSRNKAGRTCFKCGSPDHFKKDCPQLENCGNQGQQNMTQKQKQLKNGSWKNIENWRKQHPPVNGPFEKVVDGQTAKWCGKCRLGEGL